MTVYVIEEEDTGLVKIGVTTGDVGHRCSALQTGNPNKLRVIREIPGGEDVEGALHRRFAEQRLRGEWFSREGPIDEWLDDGSPAPQPLPHMSDRMLNLMAIDGFMRLLVRAFYDYEVALGRSIRELVDSGEIGLD